MPTTRLSSKERVIFPKSVRSAERWQPGTEFSVELTEDGVLLRPMRMAPATRLEDVASSLAYGGPPKSIAEMDEAIAGGIATRHDRGRY